MLPTKCEVCGKDLGLRHWWRGLRRGRAVTFDYAAVTGERREVEGRWLCGQCERRAARAARRSEAADGSASR